MYTIGDASCLPGHSHASCYHDLCVALLQELQLYFKTVVARPELSVVPYMQCDQPFHLHYSLKAIQEGNQKDG